MTAEQRRPSGDQDDASDQLGSGSGGDGSTEGFPSQLPECRHHGVARCTEHGCPWCFADEYGAGECETCDQLTRRPARIPVLDCPDGEDCLICTSCDRCKCQIPICRHCDRCTDHAGAVDCLHSWWDQAAQRWVDSPDEPALAHCQGHGQVQVCTQHDDCPDDEDCPLWIYGAGPIDAEHVHCPYCWAEAVLRALREPGSGRPPAACASCRALLSPGKLDSVVAWLDQAGAT